MKVPTQTPNIKEDRNSKSRKSDKSQLGKFIQSHKANDCMNIYSGGNEWKAVNLTLECKILQALLCIKTQTCFYLFLVYHFFDDLPLKMVR